jgi:hypothetical protein
MLAAFVPMSRRVQHTLIVATAAIGAGVAGATLKLSVAEGRDANIGLAADVLLLDVENRKNRVEVMTRGAIEREVRLGLAARGKTAERGQPQEGR